MANIPQCSHFLHYNEKIVKLIDKYAVHTRINDCFNWLIPFYIFCCEITLVCKDFAYGVENLKKKTNKQIKLPALLICSSCLIFWRMIHRKRDENQRQYCINRK